MFQTKTTRYEEKQKNMGHNKKKNQSIETQMKNIISEVKISLDGINSRLETAGEKISEFKDSSRNYAK